MGWSFRRSKSLGPLRVGLRTGGMSASIGTRRIRMGNSTSRRRGWLSIRLPLRNLLPQAAPWLKGVVAAGPVSAAGSPDRGGRRWRGRSPCVHRPSGARTCSGRCSDHGGGSRPAATPQRQLNQWAQDLHPQVAHPSRRSNSATRPNHRLVAAQMSAACSQISASRRSSDRTSADSSVVISRTNLCSNLVDQITSTLAPPTAFTTHPSDSAPGSARATTQPPKPAPVRRAP